MVVNKKLTYPDVVRLIGVVLKSEYSQHYKIELIDALVGLK